MGVWSDITGIVANVAPVVGSFFGPVGTAVGAGVGYVAAKLHTVSNVVSSAVSAVSDLAGGVTLTSIGSVLASINGFVNGLRGSIQSFLDPIKQTLDGVTSLARNIQDGLIQPIVGPITGTINAVHDLVAALHGDLSAGISGLLRIPTDVANALTSTDAAFGRAIGQLGLNNEDIAKNTLVPGMAQAGSGPLGDIHGVMSQYAGLFTDPGAKLDTLTLAQGSATSQVHAQIASLEQGIQNGATWYDRIAQSLLSIFWLVPMLELSNEPELMRFRKATLKAAPEELLSTGEALEAYKRGIIDDVSLSDELGSKGIDPTRTRALKELLTFLPHESTVVRWYARGLINEGERNAYLKQHGLNPDQIVALLQADLEIPSPGLGADVYGRIAAQKQGFMSSAFNTPIPQEVDTVNRENYLSSEAAQYEWLRHWRIPEYRWWIVAMWRGLRTRSEVHAAMQASNVPEEIWDDLIAVENRLFETWMVPDMIALGLSDKQYWMQYMARLGYDAQDAEIFYQYGISKQKKSKATTAADLQKLSLSNAATLYDDGVMTHDEYISVLESHGYSLDAATLTAQLTDIKRAIADRKTYATQLVDEVKLGITTIDNAVSQMYSQGFTEAEVMSYQTKMHAAKVVGIKGPTRAELDSLAKKGVISESDWTAAMTALNYDPNWIPILWKLV